MHILAIASAAHHARPWHWTPRHVADLAILALCAIGFIKVAPGMFAHAHNDDD